MGKRTASVNSEGIGDAYVRITRQRIASALIGLMTKNNISKTIKSGVVI